MQIRTTPSGSQPCISVIIPVYNGAACIPECLNALNNQDVPRDNYEIIVVDDGSDDGTADIAKSHADQVIRTENQGSAAARNTGAHHASGDILLFTDADCQPCTDWIRRMTKPFDDMTIAGTKGAYFSRQDTVIARFVQAEYESKYRYMAQFDSIDFIDTYSAGFRRQTFLELDGYDESFPGASVEDQEFSFRMAEAGHTMVFVPKARVYHRHADTVAWYFKKKFNIGFWKVKVLRTHPSKTITDTHTPQTLKLQLILAASLLPAIACIPIVGGLPPALVALLFIAAGWRETSQCIRDAQPLLAIISPGIMLVRSFALGFGLLFGLVNTKTKESG